MSSAQKKLLLYFAIVVVLFLIVLTLFTWYTNLTYYYGNKPVYDSETTAVSETQDETQSVDGNYLDTESYRQVNNLAVCPEEGCGMDVTSLSSALDLSEDERSEVEQETFRKVNNINTEEGDSFQSNQSNVSEEVSSASDVETESFNYLNTLEVE